MLDLNLAKAANLCFCEEKILCEGHGIHLEAATCQGCASLTCFIMECRATEGNLYFLSIMFSTWQSLEGRKKPGK